MTDTPAKTTTDPVTRADIYVFCGKLRQSQKRDLAERFGLDMRRDFAESDLDRDKGWLAEAKTLGRLGEMMAAAREMETANAR